ncbi:MAG TPA: hypothetical protein VH518_13125 [Tepidisphaeraceae bacterium]|jgi:hypothetical protein
MSRIVALCVVVFSFALVSKATAQIIYEPVQYQFRAEGTEYYYGGTNPMVHAMAAEPWTPGRSWGRINGRAFSSENLRSFREVNTEPPRVFSDYWRWGLENAHLVGMTGNDARNEAMANLPRYFAKRDLAAAAVRDCDGAWHIPAQAGSDICTYSSGGLRIDPSPRIMPRPLMIIPKEMLNQPLPQPQAPTKQVSDNRLVAAN